MTIIPPYLHIGDKVGIAAPARSIAPSALAPTISLLQSWGLEVVVPQELFAIHHQWAGDDETRARVMQRLLDDDAIAAIVCARGGYGTVRIIDRLDFNAFLRHPKWIVGYSDATVLHSHILTRYGVATLHATMPINITAESLHSPATETLRQALFGETLRYPTPPHPFNRTGNAQGPLVGGNLSILYSLCGSPSSIDTTGKILFVEDLDEYRYHIDRMMQNLKRNGMLNGLAALVVGAFSDMHDNSTPFGYAAEEIIRDAVEEYDYPLLFGCPAGHIGKENHALRFGTTARLTVTPQGGTMAMEH